jgi:hypothetical protein
MTLKFPENSTSKYENLGANNIEPGQIELLDRTDTIGNFIYSS